jgi:hypothetical protein
VNRNFPNFVRECEVGRLRQYASDYIGIVRFFGGSRIRPCDIAINCKDQPFKIADSKIAKFAKKTARLLRKEGRLYDGPLAMKLAACDLVNRPARITVQPVDYALQAGTCFALDLQHKYFDDFGGTLRDYYRHDCEKPAVENNPLAICLGVSGCLIVDDRGDRSLLKVVRSKRLASLESTIGPSVAGVVDYTDQCSDLSMLIEWALGREIEEELGLARKEYEITPLAWAIELFRGERPQIFCLIQTLLNREKLTQRLESIPPEQREFDSFEFVPLYGGLYLDQTHIDSLNPEAKMNFFLAEEYLSR